MPALNISNIKDAKLGSTPLTAVYKGSTQIYGVRQNPPFEPIDPDDIEVEVSSSYWVRGDGRACGDMNDWVNAFSGTHNITDPGRLIEYASNTPPSSNWYGWDAFLPDTFTKPNEPFEMIGTTTTCTDTDSGDPYYPKVAEPKVRIRFKLSDGTITDWAYSP